MQRQHRSQLTGLRICVITQARSGILHGPGHFRKLVQVLAPLAQEIFIITINLSQSVFLGPKIQLRNVKHDSKTQSMLLRIIWNIMTQLRISYHLIKASGKTEIIIFFVGGECLPLPMLAAKLFRKKVILALAGSSLEVARSQKNLLSKAISFLSKINRALSDRIIVYSERLVKEWGLEKHTNKISIAHEHFLDFNRFRVQHELVERDSLVGYIGALSEEKGILNLLKAIPEVLQKEEGVRFLIGGEGRLRGKVEEYLNKENLNNKVKFAGWISHSELPEQLNKLKLLFLPSYTEGLPNIMLEAMACGTPVLATAVGAIPDVIKDNETGFIMEDNSPECIARNVIRALSHPDLSKIAKNARALVEKEYTYEAAVERYRNILASLKKDLRL